MKIDYQFAFILLSILYCFLGLILVFVGFFNFKSKYSLFKGMFINNKTGKIEKNPLTFLEEATLEEIPQEVKDNCDKEDLKVFRLLMNRYQKEMLFRKYSLAGLSFLSAGCIFGGIAIFL